eukprot:scaffold115175_cov19-Tisochrysis_lutea.AAC.1
MQGSRGPAHGEAFREHGRVNVTDESAVQELWHCTGLAGALRNLHIDGMRPTGLNPNLRFYRWVGHTGRGRRHLYEKGQRFGKHIDESIDLGDGRHTSCDEVESYEQQWVGRGNTACIKLHQGQQRRSAPDDVRGKGKQSKSSPSIKRGGHSRQPPPSQQPAEHASYAEPPAPSDSCAVQPLRAFGHDACSVFSSASIKDFGIVAFWRPR